MTVTERSVTDGPSGELSLRTAPRGGILRPKVKPKDTKKLKGQDKVVLLIHGFNVNEYDARAAYTAFHQNTPGIEKLTTAWVFWPGDLTRDQITSAPWYTFTRDRAQKSAKSLGQFIAQKLTPNSGEIELYIVAHSMGCRLALELVNYLHIVNNRVHVKHIALMAAAVPQFLVQPNGLLDITHNDADKGRVYYSKKDWVLKRLFRLGQRGESTNLYNMFFERGALGREGLSRKVRNHLRRLGPNAPDLTDSKETLGHSQYWSSRKVARQISHDLPIKGPRWAKPRPGIQGRAAPEGRSTGP